MQPNKSARALIGALWSGGITMAMVAIIAVPMIAVLGMNAMPNESGPTQTSWPRAALLVTLIAGALGTIPGALIGALRASMAVGAVVGGVWALLAGAIALGHAFGVQGLPRLLVGVSMALPGAALGLGVAWGLSRRD